MSRSILFGFHTVGGRLKVDPKTVHEVWIDGSRRDGRMRALVARLKETGVRWSEADEATLTRQAGTWRHQGVVARVEPLPMARTVIEMLDALDPSEGAPLVLVLDGVTDPHNLGACLRVADGAGATAVIAPKDHAAPINATVSKVASGAADHVPYLMVTNLARALGELKDAGFAVVGLADEAETSLYEAELAGPLALVLGAEGAGLRQLTKKTCDRLVNIPMLGAVESLNVSVAAGVCLYEAVRQRRGAAV
jgi:23S rRNA (guanosine2251-2'-O)-methyltransferase